MSTLPIRSHSLPAQVLLSLLILMLVAAPLGAQQPPAADTTFKSKVDLVLFPTIVRDKAGRHVSGLKKEDFTILENGKPQSIVVFEETKTGTTFAAPKTQPGEHTNQITAGAAPTRMTIIGLDMLNTQFMDQAYARTQLLKYLSEKLDSSEPTALVVLRSDGLHVLHDFSTSTKSLIEALKLVSGRLNINQQGQAGPANGVSVETLQNALMASSADPNASISDPAMREAIENYYRLDAFRSGPDAEYQRYNDKTIIAMTLAAFQEIADAYAGVPGRKSLIWASGGLPFTITGSGSISAPENFSQGVTFRSAGGGRAYDSTGSLGVMPESASTLPGGDLADLSPVYERTMQMLNAASVSVYPVDARGLEVFFTGANESYISQAKQQQALMNSAVSRATMDVFATMTGGKAYVNSNDLTAGFRSAADDNANYYSVGYYRDAKSSKPGWRKVEVKVAQPNVQVRARKGYMLPSEKPDSKVSKQMDIASAMTSPLEFSGFPLYVSVTQKQADAKSKRTKVKFAIWMPPEAFAGFDDKINLDVLGMVNDRKGARLDQFAQNLGGNMKPEMVDAVKKQGINYENVLQVPAGQMVVRFIVRDNLHGRLGSVILPVKLD